jgi:hypothetical protein
LSVTPAKAGVHKILIKLDSRLRGNDGTVVRKDIAVKHMYGTMHQRSFLLFRLKNSCLES